MKNIILILIIVAIAYHYYTKKEVVIAPAPAPTPEPKEPTTPTLEDVKNFVAVYFIKNDGISTNVYFQLKNGSTATLDVITERVYTKFDGAFSRSDIEEIVKGYVAQIGLMPFNDKGRRKRKNKLIMTGMVPSDKISF